MSFLRDLRTFPKVGCGIVSLVETVDFSGPERHLGDGMACFEIAFPGLSVYFSPLV